MRVTISVDNNKTIYVLPFVTEDMVKIDYGQSSNENKDSVKFGQIKVLGAEPLASVSISSFFPSGRPGYAEADSKKVPMTYVRFFRDNRKKRKPMRVVITRKDKKEVFNRLMACESFEITKISRAGDYYYTLEFEQYRLVK